MAVSDKSFQSLRMGQNAHDLTAGDNQSAGSPKGKGKADAPADAPSAQPNQDEETEDAPLLKGS